MVEFFFTVNTFSKKFPFSGQFFFGKLQAQYFETLSRESLGRKV